MANEIQGIGLDIFDISREFGSAGRLQSFTMMDRLAKYPDDPTHAVPGREQHAQRARPGSRPSLARVRRISAITPGSDPKSCWAATTAHWSFFMDSDASVMEGNDIEDLGGGSFRTIGAVRRYSRLDQYAMGLVGPADVPPFFYVQSPMNLSQPKDKESAPQVGVTFNGTRRDVLIDDVIAIHGPRVPASAESLEGPPSGLHLHRRRRPGGRSGAGRQARSHPPAVGGVLPAGD